MLQKTYHSLLAGQILGYEYGVRDIIFTQYISYSNKDIAGNDLYLVLERHNTISHHRPPCVVSGDCLLLHVACKAPLFNG
jgi:hypothetical protein